MRIEDLLQDHHILYVTEHKNVRDGWIGMNCPFCLGEGSYHLGYCLDDNYFSCWSCGGHQTTYAISKLLSINYDKAEKLVEQYGGSTSKKAKEPRVKMRSSKFSFPKSELKLFPNHKAYLEERDFDWEYLEDEWSITGTGPAAKLDGINYANRILAPIYWNGDLVSFQARDITDKHIAKYMACPPERERISHKHILYGIQEDWGTFGICVEGITDAWRLGTAAFATFGIKYTMEQVLAMAEHFDEIVVIYDPERQAQRQAKQLIRDLRGKGVVAENLVLDCDPGDLPQDDADDLVRYLIN